LSLVSFVFVVSRGWVKIEARLDEPVVLTIEWLAGLRVLIVPAVAAYFAITRPDPIYRYGAIAVATLCILWICVAYVRSIRRDIDRYVIPRRITPRQDRKLRAFLAKGPKYSIAVKVNTLDEEANQYAGQLSGAFQQSGWTSVFSTAEPYDGSVGLTIKRHGYEPDKPAERLSANS
jgi:hypothetical protein